MTSGLKLGDIAKDKITGYQGVVIARSQWLSNCDRLTVQPREVKDGKPIASRTFDETQLVFVESTDLVPVPLDRGAEPIELGDTVKDPVTGLTGVVTAITAWLEGCSILQVQPTELKDGLPVDATGLDERKAQIVTRANQKPKAVRTGGPRAEPSRGCGA